MAVATQVVWNDKLKITTSPTDAANWLKVAGVVEKLLVPLIQTEPLKRRRQKIDPAALVTYNPVAAQLSKGVLPATDNKKICNQTVAMVLIADKLINTRDARPDFIISHAQWAADSWNCYRVPRHRTSFLHLHLRCPAVLSEPFNLHFHLSSTSGVSGRRRDSSGKSLVVNVMGMRGANGLQTFLVIQPPRHKARGKVYCTQDGYCRLDILRSDTAYFECFLINPPDAQWAMTLDYCGRDPVSYPAEGRQLFPRLPQAIRNQFPWIDWAKCPEARAKKGGAASSKATSSNDSASSDDDDDYDDEDGKKPSKKMKSDAKALQALSKVKKLPAAAAKAKSPAAKKAKIPMPVPPPTRPVSASSSLAPVQPPSSRGAAKKLTLPFGRATKTVKKEPSPRILVKREPESSEDDDDIDEDGSNEGGSESPDSDAIDAALSLAGHGATITIASSSKRRISEIATAPATMVHKSEGPSALSAVAAAAAQSSALPATLPTSLPPNPLLKLPTGFPPLPSSMLPMMAPSFGAPSPVPDPGYDERCDGRCRQRLVVLTGATWTSHSSLQIRLRCCGCKTLVDSGSPSSTDLVAKHAVVVLSDVSKDYQESVPCIVESPGVLLLSLEYSSLMFRPESLDDDGRRSWRIQVSHLHPITLTPLPNIQPHSTFVLLPDLSLRPQADERGVSTDTSVPRVVTNVNAPSLPPIFPIELTSLTSSAGLCHSFPSLPSFANGLPTTLLPAPPQFNFPFLPPPSLTASIPTSASTSAIDSFLAGLSREPRDASMTLPRIGTLPPFGDVSVLRGLSIPREHSVTREQSVPRERSVPRENSGASVSREPSGSLTATSDTTASSARSFPRESTVPRDSTDYGIFSLDRRLASTSASTSSALLPVPPSLSSLSSLSAIAAAAAAAPTLRVPV